MGRTEADGQAPTWWDVAVQLKDELSLKDIAERVGVEPATLAAEFARRGVRRRIRVEAHAVHELPPEPEEELSVVASPDVAVPTASDEEEPDQDEEEVVVQVSEMERLMDADFAQCTPEELALIRQLVDQIRMNPPVKLARRRKVHRRGSSIDIRRTLRRAQRTGGDPVLLVRRRSSLRPRRVVLLADVSGSMESYARVYLHLMRGAVQALEAEAFSFSTRLTRLTRQLAMGTPDVAYEHARAVAKDWSGGTRIGQALEDFLRDYGRRGMARGSIIVIVSDGWETGDPQRIMVAMEQLGRMAHRIIWVNRRLCAILARTLPSL